MADDTETEDTGDGSVPTTAELDDRITKLDSKLDLLIERLPGGGPAGGAGDGGKGDRPASVAAEIRQQLDERDRKAAADAEAKGAADRLAEVEQRVKDMAEQPPESLVRRVEAFMGWR